MLIWLALLWAYPHVLEHDDKSNGSRKGPDLAGDAMLFLMLLLFTRGWRERRAKPGNAQVSQTLVASGWMGTCSLRIAAVPDSSEVDAAY